jgi:hypothetical protein
LDVNFLKGAMALIRDINEYRLASKNFNSQVVDKLFSVLYSLSNLLVVKPSNLSEICNGENLVRKYHSNLFNCSSSQIKFKALT